MRYTLTFSRTKKSAEYESVVVGCMQDYDDEEIPRDAAWDELTAFVYRKLDEEMEKTLENEKKKPEPKQSEPSPHKKSTVSLQTLPWQAFQEKRNTNPGENGWIFSNTRGADDLAQEIFEKGSVLKEMDGHQFLCRFGGKDNIFINRLAYKENMK